MSTLRPETVRRFFNQVIASFAEETARSTIPDCLVTTHILRDRHYFLEAISNISNIVSVIPKPKSIDRNTLAWIKHRYPIHPFSREDISLSTLCSGIFATSQSARPFVIADVGGYYSTITKELHKSQGERFLGVVEDTENGHQRYAKLPQLAVPVISVARSPLKNSEDFLVGQSIVHSAESLIREQGDILQGRRATVIGYGKLGRSISATLRERHVETLVYDIDPIAAIEARSHGFNVANCREEALNNAGLIFCATGNIALRGRDFELLPSGAYIATATSSDDELETAELRINYRRRRIADFITEYRRIGHNIFLLNHGQAVNFIHGAVVGPFIYLIQAEILASICLLRRGGLQHGMMECDPAVRQSIARLWIENFSINHASPRTG